MLEKLIKKKKKLVLVLTPYNMANIMVHHLKIKISFS